MNDAEWRSNRRSVTYSSGMKKVVVAERPAYFLDSVDNALQLLQVLRDEGRLRLTDAAERLRVAPSTAHRLLSMLVYRGFAVQDDSRGYLAGPAIGIPPAASAWTTQFRRLARPHLELLLGKLDETVNLVIRVGIEVRFLLTLESSQFLRVGDRQGSVLAARRASGGKAMLAALDPVALARLYDGVSGTALDPLSARELDALAIELDTIRSHGYAVNIEETETGLVAVGAALVNRAGEAVGAFSVAAPSVRRQALFSEPTIAAILATKKAIESDIGDLSVGGPGHDRGAAAG